MTIQAVPAGAEPLLSDFTLWGLRPAALQALQAAIERGEISVRDISIIVPGEILRDKSRFSAFITAVGQALRSRGTKLVADRDERDYRERMSALTVPQTETKPKAKVRPKADIEDDVFGETNAPASVRKKKELLTRDQEHELGQRIFGNKDLAARNQLIEHNLRLVHWVAKRYLWSKMEYEDLIGYGNLGLITAAEKFDPNFGKFSTYATWWIRQSIGRSILDFGGTIRLPVHIQEFRSKILKAARKKAEELGRVPTLSEVADEAQIPKDKVQRVLRQTRLEMVSLDSSLDSGDPTSGTLADIIPDEFGSNPEVTIEAKQELAVAQNRVNNLLENLSSMLGSSERDVEIFKSFYGFDKSGRRKTLEAVGDHFKITRERIRQIVAKIWQKVSDRGSDMDHDQLLEELVRIDELGKIAAAA